MGYETSHRLADCSLIYMAFFEVACTGERGMVAFVQVSMNISPFKVGCTAVTWTGPLSPAVRASQLNGAAVNRCAVAGSPC